MSCWSATEPVGAENSVTSVTRGFAQPGLNGSMAGKALRRAIVTARSPRNGHGRGATGRSSARATPGPISGSGPGVRREFGTLGTSPRAHLYIGLVLGEGGVAA